MTDFETIIQDCVYDTLILLKSMSAFVPYDHLHDLVHPSIRKVLDAQSRAFQGRSNVNLVQTFPSPLTGGQLCEDAVDFMTLEAIPEDQQVILEHNGRQVCQSADSLYNFFVTNPVLSSRYPRNKVLPMREFSISQEHMVQIIQKARPEEDVVAVLQTLEGLDEEQVRANRQILVQENIQRDLAARRAELDARFNERLAELRREAAERELRLEAERAERHAQFQRRVAEIREEARLHLVAMRENERRRKFAEWQRLMKNAQDLQRNIFQKRETIAFNTQELNRLLHVEDPTQTVATVIRRQIEGFQIEGFRTQIREAQLDIQRDEARAQDFRERARILIRPFDLEVDDPILELYMDPRQMVDAFEQYFQLVPLFRNYAVGALLYNVFYAAGEILAHFETRAFRNSIRFNQYLASVFVFATIVKGLVKQTTTRPTVQSIINVLFAILALVMMIYRDIIQDILWVL